MDCVRLPEKNKVQMPESGGNIKKLPMKAGGRSNWGKDSTLTLIEKSMDSTYF